MTAPTPSPAAPEDFAPTNDTPVTEKTPEQKGALAELFGCGKTAPEEMSDAELVEALAAFMGWERQRFGSGGNFLWVKIGSFDPNAQTFKSEATANWNPLSSDKDARDILDRMRSHWGCTFSIRLLSTGKTVVEFLDHHGMIVGQYRHRDHLKALCIAALHAVRSSSSSNASIS